MLSFWRLRDEHLAQCGPWPYFKAKTTNGVCMGSENRRSPGHGHGGNSTIFRPPWILSVFFPEQITHTNKCIHNSQSWKRSHGPHYNSNYNYKYTYNIPICSMYGIFNYIWAILGVNVGKYTIHGAYRIHSSIYLTTQIINRSSRRSTKESEEQISPS